MTDAPDSLTPTQLAAYFAFTEVGALLRPAVEKQLKEAEEKQTNGAPKEAAAVAAE